MDALYDTLVLQFPCLAFAFLNQRLQIDETLYWPSFGLTHWISNASFSKKLNLRKS